VTPAAGARNRVGVRNGSGALGGDDSEVQVVTWWESGSEKEGLQALQKVFEEKFPDTEFVNAAIAGGGSQAKQKLAADLAAGNPPDTFQAHAGAEMTDYIEAGQVEDLTSLYDERGLNEAFPQDLLDRLTMDGKICSIPSTIHRANVVWANPTVLKDSGVDPDAVPADIDAWITDMEEIQAAGYTPITVGSAWTQTELLEMVLIADLGADGYSGLFDGTTDWASADVTAALEHFATIMSYTDSSLYAEDWEPAMQPVVDGKAAYNVMGDWVYLGLTSQGKTLGTDIIEFPVPGTDGVYDFLADSFTLPVGAAHPGGARNWLETISSKEGKIAFNSVKGSIPARSDLSEDELADFSDYQRDQRRGDEVRPGRHRCGRPAAGAGRRRGEHRASHPSSPSPQRSTMPIESSGHVSASSGAACARRRAPASRDRVRSTRLAGSAGRPCGRDALGGDGPARPVPAPAEVRPRPRGAVRSPGCSSSPCSSTGSSSPAPTPR